MTRAPARSAKQPPRLLGLMALLLLSLAHCAGPRTAGLCPEATKLRCLTAKECAHDAKRGCHVCSCKPPWNPDREDHKRRYGK